MQTISKFQVREAGQNCLVLTCSGGLSWEDREALAHGLEPFLQARPDLRGIIFDLAAVEFVNSAGLGALFQLIQRVRGRGARTVFASTPHPLVRLFEAVGLDRIAGLHPTVEAAIAALEEKEPC